MAIVMIRATKALLEVESIMVPGEHRMLRFAINIILVSASVGGSSWPV